MNSGNSNSTKQSSRGRSSSSHLPSASAGILLDSQPALELFSTQLASLLAKVVSGDGVAKVVRRALQAQALLGGIRAVAAAAAEESASSASCHYGSSTSAPPRFLMLVNAGLQGVTEYGSTAPAPSASAVTTSLSSGNSTALLTSEASANGEDVSPHKEQSLSSVLAEVSTLQTLFLCATDFRTQAQALCCLGHAVRGLISISRTLTPTAATETETHEQLLHPALHEFMQSATSCASATQPEELREAAVEALGACGLLLLPPHTQSSQINSDTSCHASHQIASQSEASSCMDVAPAGVEALLLPLQCRALQLVVPLMEDEDNKVRERAAVLAAAAMLHARTQDLDAAQSTSESQQHLPVCVESVSKQLMGELVLRFGSMEGVSWGGGAADFVLDGGSRATLQQLVARAVSTS